MIVFQVVFWLISTAALLSLGACTWLVYNERLELFDRAHYGAQLSFREKTFLLLAAVGFLVCIEQGTEAMLGWMPLSWGHVGEDGDYEPAVRGLATLACMVIGVPLLVVLASAGSRVKALSAEVDKLLKEQRDRARFP